MNSSPIISSLAAALVTAQKAFSPAVKAKANPAFKGSLYVDLASAIDAAQPALLENGIAVVQGTSGDVAQQSITVTTRVIHSSGEWLEDSLTLPALNPAGSYNAQSAGSAITYARRYSYMAILGFAPEDDDGNGAAGTHNQPPPRTQQPESVRGPSPTISEAQSKRFFALTKAGNKTNDQIRAYLMNVCKCEKSLEITRDKYDAACKWAESKPTPTAPDPMEITDDDIPF